MFLCRRSTLFSAILNSSKNNLNSGASLLVLRTVSWNETSSCPTYKILSTRRNQSTSTNQDEIWLEDNLKLEVKESDKETYLAATPLPTGREGKVLEKVGGSEACVLCRLNLKQLSYTDVLIISQFIKKNGEMVTYHESKLCTRQYNKLVRLVRQAQRCNLIRRPGNYLVPGPWHDLNTYLEPDRKRDRPMEIVKKEYWKI